MAAFIAALVCGLNSEVLRIRTERLRYRLVLLNRGICEVRIGNGNVRSARLRRTDVRHQQTIGGGRPVLGNQLFINGRRHLIHIQQTSLQVCSDDSVVGRFHYRVGGDLPLDGEGPVQFFWRTRGVFIVPEIHILVIWNEGSICGGSGYGGRPTSQLNAGVMPWSGDEKAYWPIKPS